jgi:Carboxypeptidase regulatory-like domain
MTPRLFLHGIVLAVAAAVLAGSAGPALAQQADKSTAKILISYDQKVAPTPQQIIVLRPNIEQPVYLYVSNPGPDIIKNVAVKLVKVLPDNTPQTIAETKVPKLQPGERERLVFGKPAPPAPAGKPIPWPELEGPPFRFEIWAQDADAKEPSKTPVAVKIMDPREYMTASDLNYQVGPQRFSVTIQSSKEIFRGPPAVVQLVLSPEVIPGLLTGKKSGAYQQFITEAGQKVQLVADKLQFKGTPPEHGRIYVTVDGFKRAFIFNNSFTEGAPVPLSGGTRARIVAPRYAVPGAKLAVRLEVDNPPPLGGGFVDLGFDRAGNGQFAEDLLPGFREQHVFFVPEGPKGGMAFKTVVHDWASEEDTAEVYGPRQFRVQLYDRDPKTGGKGKLIDLVDEVSDQAKTEERLPLFAGQPDSPYAPLTFDAEKKAVLAEVILDGTEPEGLKFVGWPKQLVRGKTLPLKATAFDKESGIRKVTFFLGEPVDNKLPPKAVVAVGKPGAPGADVWEGELPIPTAKPGTFDVSVQFTNGAGLSATETVRIELVDAPKGSKKGTTIKGTVFDDDRTPPGVAVTLADDKGVAKAVTKTKDKGQFVFEGVAPGSYFIVAVRSADRTRGQTSVLVPEATPLIEGVTVRLSR